eukprot:CAMPEP_0113941152 /NCGR_PEP_ID=MMETSP1339-20121228/7134_1 /TAXON_ID=94617 /ORGANISM="Fibrocapsa japonica" /LENGTH=382 /DNA_ID=CAMNT_0000945217 /DNA_START=218 /DNA_END=1362 /DNA_ORIENTATION=+ /assembly_acc=CAM_ASM_000762
MVKDKLPSVTQITGNKTQIQKVAQALMKLVEVLLFIAMDMLVMALILQSGGISDVMLKVLFLGIVIAVANVTEAAFMAKAGDSTNKGQQAKAREQQKEQPITCFLQKENIVLAMTALLLFALNSFVVALPMGVNMSSAVFIPTTLAMALLALRAMGVIVKVGVDDRCQDNASKWLWVKMLLLTLLGPVVAVLASNGRVPKLGWVLQMISAGIFLTLWHAAQLTLASQNQTLIKAVEKRVDFSPVLRINSDVFMDDEVVDEDEIQGEALTLQSYWIIPGGILQAPPALAPAPAPAAGAAAPPTPSSARVPGGGPLPPRRLVIPVAPSRALGPQEAEVHWDECYLADDFSWAQLLAAPDLRGGVLARAGSWQEEEESAPVEHSG